MKNWKTIIVLAFLLGTLSSCSFYNPIYTNTPNYEKVGEVNFGANLGTTADVNFSTNPIEHLSIIGDFSYSGQLTNQTGRFANQTAPELYKFDRYQTQVGVGYYYYLMDNVQHDFHVGYGIGNAADEYNSGAYKANFSNFFIQSAIVFELDAYTKAVFSSKFNRLTFSDFEYARGDLFSTPPAFNNEQTYWLNQFGLGIIVPYGPIEINLQGQVNVRFVNDFSNNGFDDLDRPVGAYLGINFNIDQIFNRSE